MGLHWDLAKRLMLGSRRNASTRMSAIMALALVGLTALGATLSVGINQGMQNIVAQEITKTEQMPDGRLELSFRSRSSYTPQAVERWEEMMTDIDWAVRQKGGEGIAYVSSIAYLVPKDKLSQFQDILLDVRDFTPDSGSTRHERVEVRKQMRAQATNAIRQLREMGVVKNASLCHVPGYDIPAGQVWVVDRPNLIQGGSLASGSKYAAVMFRSVGEMGMPALRSVLAGDKITPAAAIPPACDYLVDKAYFDSIFIRSPGLAKFAYVWWGEEGLKEALVRWNLNSSGVVSHAAHEREWGSDVSLEMSGQWIKDYQVESLASMEIMLLMTRRVCWAIVGILSLIAAYQMCSLLVLLGTQFHSELALLRSLGMRRANICGVFLLAACVFALLASIVGALLGLGLIQAYNTWSDQISSTLGLENITIATPSAGFWVAMGVSLVVGVLAGLFPSWQAANTDPAVIWSDT